MAKTVVNLVNLVIVRRCNCGRAWAAKIAAGPLSFVLEGGRYLNKRNGKSMGRRVGVCVVMSTTLTDFGPNAESKVMQQSSDVVEAKRSIWSVFAITCGALASVAWTGFLACATGKIFGLW